MRRIRIEKRVCVETKPTKVPNREMEATVGIEPTIGVLQTPALTTWPRRHKKMERKTRFELATPSLARRCSTTEPLPPKPYDIYHIAVFAVNEVLCRGILL